MQALIHPNEPIGPGVRVTDLCERPFEVAEPLFWVFAPAGVNPRTHCFNMQTGQFELIPIDTEPPAKEAFTALPPIETVKMMEASTLMPRPVREFLLAQMEDKAKADGVSPGDLYANDPAYRRVKDLDNAIRAKRAEHTAWLAEQPGTVLL